MAKNEDEHLLGEMINLFLKKNKETASEVIKATGIPKATFSNLRSGASPQKLSHIKTLAAHWGTTMEFLLW